MRALYASLLATLFVTFLYTTTDRPSRYRTPNTVFSKPIAIGISLTPSYGTVSLRVDDGSFLDIKRIDGDKEYMQMMARLSNFQAAHPSPPYRSPREKWNDVPREIRRSIRKRFGYPASSDVAILSKMLEGLFQSVEVLYPTLSQSLIKAASVVVVSYPGLAGLYEEDIRDAMIYLSLRTPKSLIYQPREVFASYAGYDMGLCETYTNLEKCHAENLKLPVRETLLVQVTNGWTLFHCAAIRESVDLAYPVADIDAFNIKSDFKDWYNDMIRRLLTLRLQKRHRFRRVPEEITIIMTGENAGDEGVQRVITETVKDFGSKVSLLVSNPEFVAARGAAELAWRANTL